MLVYWRVSIRTPGTLVSGTTEWSKAAWRQWSSPWLKISGNSMEIWGTSIENRCTSHLFAVWVPISLGFFDAFWCDKNWQPVVVTWKSLTGTAGCSSAANMVEWVLTYPQNSSKGFKKNGVPLQRKQSYKSHQSISYLVVSTDKIDHWGSSSKYVWS